MQMLIFHLLGKKLFAVMANLPRSDVSFRRSGSSGSVWDDQVEKVKCSSQKADRKPYHTVEVEPTIEPPSPKVSGCGGICLIFGRSTVGKPEKRGHRTL
ncbi:hypothetical protein QVD17_27651 [Tagetes erecta]|uniref:Uncharacterized protein n=1 Tax=Tagetes erecta TaxID=13708 RepID=A0AAD8KBT8_TARER|nr:hypothetical protein QVD17_27651 [Tagetes erecta]